MITLLELYSEYQRVNTFEEKNICQDCEEFLYNIIVFNRWMREMR